MYPEKTNIYTLTDPRTGLVRYVGKTNTPELRYIKHCCQFETNKKSSWSKSLRAVGLKPKMDIIDEVPYCDWRFWERHYINLFKASGAKLVNMMDGGIGAELAGSISKRSKPVLQYSLSGEFIKEFPSIRNASHANSVDHARISFVCMGRRFNSAGGFMWRYKDGEIILKIAPVKRMPFSPIPVLQINENGDIIKEWKSVTHAAIGLKIDRTLIWRRCNGINSGAHAFSFKYKNNA